MSRMRHDISVTCGATMAEDAPRSPCVSICALDESDICIGCLRSADEIARWHGMSDAQKRQVLVRIDERANFEGISLHGS